MQGHLLYAVELRSLFLYILLGFHDALGKSLSDLFRVFLEKPGTKGGGRSNSSGDHLKLSSNVTDALPDEESNMLEVDQVSLTNNQCLNCEEVECFSQQILCL